MAGVPAAVLWAAFAAGLFGCVSGGATLVRRRATLVWPRRRARWKAWGWSQLLVGASFVLMAAPRLADGPTQLVFRCSVASLSLLFAGIVVRAVGEACRR